MFGWKTPPLATEDRSRATPEFAAPFVLAWRQSKRVLVASLNTDANLLMASLNADAINPEFWSIVTVARPTTTHLDFGRNKTVAHASATHIDFGRIKTVAHASATHIDFGRIKTVAHASATQLVLLCLHVSHSLSVNLLLNFVFS